MTALPAGQPTCEDFYRTRIDSHAGPEDYREFFQLLWKMNGVAVFRLAFQHLGGEEDAREICQEVFVRAMAHLQKAGVGDRDRLNFRAWLRTITRNLVYDRFRRAETMPRRAGDEALEVVPVMQPPEQRMIGAEDLEILNRCMKKLTDQARRIVELRELQGLSEKDIAAQLGTTSNAVSVGLHRARKQLRHCVEMTAIQERKSL
jgi:RNA polymerase sigma-70 factor (ECF subfamily)